MTTTAQYLRFYAGTARKLLREWLRGVPKDEQVQVAEQIALPPEPSKEPELVWPPHRNYPLVYFIEPSSICNAACIFCHYPQLRDSGKRIVVAEDATVEKAIALVEADIEARGIGALGYFPGVSLTPTTGDILVNRNWMDYAKRILPMPKVGWLDMVSNGILLNEKNIDALLALEHREKINFSLSTGGLDRETYKFMFGTDMFDKVRANINLLMKTLKERDIRLNVAVNLRVPEAEGITPERIASVYNEAGYEWAHYSVLDTFKDVPEDVPGKHVLKMRDTLEPRDFVPCGMLLSGAMNVSAEGNITACGCHYSQKPGDTSLLLGTVDSTVEALTARRKELIDGWQLDNHVPDPCKTCQHYHHHDGIEDNDLLFHCPAMKTSKALHALSPAQAA